jgi:hypothetical protein
VEAEVTAGVALHFHRTQPMTFELGSARHHSLVTLPNTPHQFRPNDGTVTVETRTLRYPMPQLAVVVKKCHHGDERKKKAQVAIP